MAPVTGCAPVTGDQYMAPRSKVTYRVSPRPEASGEVGMPSGPASLRMASHLVKMAPPRNESRRSCGPDG